MVIAPSWKLQKIEKKTSSGILTSSSFPSAFPTYRGVQYVVLSQFLIILYQVIAFAHY